MKRLENNLWIGLKSIRKKDISPFRQLMFAHYCRYSLVARILVSLYGHQSLRPLLNLAVLLSSLRKMFFVELPHSRNGESCGIYHYANEKRTLMSLSSQMGLKSFFISYPRRMKGFLASIPSIVGFLARPYSLTLFRVSARLSRNSDFLVYSRQVEFLILYSYFKSLIKDVLPPKVVVISSESNPEIIAPALALRDRSRIAYVNHGYLNRDLGIFFQDYTFLSYPLLRKRIIENVLHQGTNLIFDLPQRQSFEVKGLRSLQHVLVASSVVFDEGKIRELVLKLLPAYPELVVTVRLHPNQVLYPSHPLSGFSHDRLRISDGSESLLSALEGVDLVIGGETTVHLDALAARVPSAHYKLDDIVDDHYDLVKEGLIPRLPPVDSIVEGINCHYQVPQWKEVISQFFYCTTTVDDFRKALLNDIQYSEERS